jgi:hypothetical protein
MHGVFKFRPLDLGWKFNQIMLGGNFFLKKLLILYFIPWSCPEVDTQKYKHKFIFIFKLFFNCDFFNEYEFEIWIVKIGYENRLLSHLWEPPYLKTNFIKISKRCDILINSHEFLIFKEPCHLF